MKMAVPFGGFLGGSPRVVNETFVTFRGNNPEILHPQDPTVFLDLGLLV